MQVEPFFDPATWSLSYVVHGEGVGVVIDPVRDYDPKSGRTSWRSAERVATYAERERLRIPYAIDTHAHADHLTGLPYFKERFGARTVTGATVPLLVYVFGLDAKPAIASSLLIVGGASGFGAFQHARAGHVEARTAIAFGGAGMAGAYTGGRAGALLDGSLLLLLFAGMMLLTAAAMWQGRRVPPAAAPGPGATARHLAHGFGVGMFSGLVGAGGGFLIVPALVLWSGLPIARAVGTSLLIICLQCLAAFAGYASRVQIDYALVGYATLGAVAGSIPGSRLARHVDPASLRRAFAGFVVAMAVLVMVREADVWLDTARASLPASVPQLVFALLVLAIGLAAGRLTRRAPADPLAERAFWEGAGI